MLRRLSAILGALALAGLPGCLYVHTKIPLDIDLNRTTLGTKVGESQFESILWLVAWGDAGTKAAAENGKITTILHADQETLLVFFGVYYRHKTILYGE